MKFRSKLIIAAMLATASAPLAAQAVAPMPVAVIEGTRLDVAARGEVRRVPDLATISAGVVTQAPTAAQALADNAKAMDRVLAALKAAGVAERDVQTANIGLDPQYRYGENVPPVITGYQARNTVSVRFRDISKAGAILDALVKQGANQINGPTLSLANPDEALDEARVDAIAKARARAEIYAKTLGMRVVRIVAVSEASDMPGPPVPVMYARAQAMDAAESKIVPGEQEIGVSLNVVFELR
ncbi:SIMPL domain-containing protein [Sphingomonas gilva]|uniref:SIMPL domain-containing protein n=1 Tax=Sphingomonas gilva TaxID=2305907 RepID=A0A396RL34_9SPHN|nr:SIMPL domain-containing protein [Sphingomonas gilva]RHW16829.1 SIMPL domain-containing protein [Sphingomonas gilva]